MKVKTLLLAVLLIASPGAGQHIDRHFDPVAYIATLKLFQEWTPGSLHAPPNGVQYFTDSLFAGNPIPVAFTVVNRDVDSSGWTLRLDYDADRFGNTRLVRIYGWKPDADGAPDGFAFWENRIRQMLSQKIRGREMPDSATVSWSWDPRDRYRLVLKREPDGRTGAHVLTLRLDIPPEHAVPPSGREVRTR